MSLNLEQFTSDYQELLYNNNEFILFGVDDSIYSNGESVKRPVIEEDETALINPQYPLVTSATSGDGFVKYFLENIVVKPTALPDFNKNMLIYDKRKSLMYNKYMTMYDQMGDIALTKWSAGVEVIPTTGATTDLKPAGASGLRKAITGQDLRTAAATLDRQKIASSDRVLVLASDLYWQLLSDQDIKDAAKFGAATQQKGVVLEYAGFKILKRASTSLVNGSTIKPMGSAVAAGDSLSATIYHSGSVSYCKGTPEFYIQEKDINWQGSVLSCRDTFGAAQTTKTKRGIVVLSQGIVA